MMARRVYPADRYLGQMVERNGHRYSVCFIKDDNINEVNESIEKLLQVKLAANKQTLVWTAVTDIDPAI